MSENGPELRLVAEDLGVSRGGRAVFQNIALAVAAGEVLALTGPNGAGKTTLLRILAGFAQPDAGTVRLEPAAEQPMIHYLGHQDGLKPALTLAENLAFWRQAMGAPALPVTAALGQLGLAALADIPTGYLSAGQKRRAALARLVTNHRPVWLLDEPTAALDTAAEQTLGRLLASHRAAGGIAVAATHAPLPVTPDRTLALAGAA